MGKLISFLLLLTISITSFSQTSDWHRSLRVGSDALDPSLKFQVSGTDKASLPVPKMSTSNKSAISSPTLGASVWDTTLGKGSSYTSGGWDSHVYEAMASALINKTINADSNAISNIDTGELKAGVLDTDITSVSGSDDTIPSAKAAKTLIDTKLDRVAATSTQVIYVSKAGSDVACPAIPCGDGSFDKPFLTLDRMNTVITDASGSKKYMATILPGAYTEVSTYKIKAFINLRSLDPETVSIKRLDSSAVVIDFASTSTSKRVSIQGIGFTNGLTVDRTSVSGGGANLDLDRVTIGGAFTYSGTGAGSDFLALNDTRLNSTATMNAISLYANSSSLNSTVTIGTTGGTTASGGYMTYSYFENSYAAYDLVATAATTHAHIIVALRSTIGNTMNLSTTGTGTVDYYGDVTSIPSPATTYITKAGNSTVTPINDGTSLSNTPSGNLAAVNVQAALNELQTDVDTRALDSAAVHKTGNETVAGDKTFTGKFIASSTTNGFVPCPNMTQTQRDAIASPVSGGCIYNTTAGTLNIYNGTIWKAAGGGISAWATATVYAIGDLVIQSSKIYQALTAHTSGTFATDLAALKWTEISATTASVTPSAGAVAYTDSDSLEVTAVGTSGQVLQSNGTSAPTFVNKSISGKAGSATSVTIEELQTPSVQLTNTATGKYRLETGSDNIMPDPGMEAATTSWSGYDDSSAAVVDGTGGTVTTTCQPSSSSPLEDSKSLLITKGAANYQGEGCSINETISEAGKYKMHLVTFDYEATHANYLDDYIKVYMVSPSGAVIEVVAGDNGVKANGVGGTFIGTFQAQEAGVYKGALHIYDSSSNAWTFKADSFDVSRRKRPVRGAVITDQKIFTPDYQAFGTVASSEMYYTRTGNRVGIYGRFTAGTVTGGTAAISFPNGWIPAAINGSTAYVKGRWWKNSASGSTRKSGNLRLSVTDTYIQFGSDDYTTASAPFTGLAASTLFSNGDLIGIELEGVVIAGLQSNLQLSEDGGQRRIESKLTSSTTSITAAGGVQTVIFPTSVLDDVAMCSTSTGLCTLKEPGCYDVKASIGAAATLFTTAQAMNIYVNLDSTSVALNNWRGNGASTSILIPIAATVCGLKDQTISIKSASDVNVTLNGALAQNFFTISKNSSPQTLAGSETVALEYTNATNQSIPNTTNTTITNWTMVNNTHGGSFDAVTGIFSAPIPGTYSICGAIDYTPNNTTGYRALLVSYNPGSIIRTLNEMNALSVFQFVAGCTQFKMSKGDTLRLSGLHSKGSSETLTGSTQTNYMSIHRVGN